jgi:periplasmic mercuric ion binding protein
MRPICWTSGLAVLALASVAFAGEPRRTTLGIPAMDCPLCPITVSRALRKLPGVLKVEAKLDTKTAQVTYDPDRVSLERMVRAVGDAGYPATIRNPRKQ